VAGDLCLPEGRSGPASAHLTEKILKITALPVKARLDSSRIACHHAAPEI
jgi:hypothetical protein